MQQLAVALTQQPGLDTEMSSPPSLCLSLPACAPPHHTTQPHHRGRALASSAVSFLLGDDEDLEPDASRIALLSAPGQAPTALDVAVTAAQKVRIDCWLLCVGGCGYCCGLLCVKQGRLPSAAATSTAGPASVAVWQPEEPLCPLFDLTCYSCMTTTCYICCYSGCDFF